MHAGSIQVRLLGILAIGVMSSLIACSGGGSAAPASSPIQSVSQSVVLELQPTSTEILTDESVALTAKVSGTTDTSVTWSVDGIPNGNANVGSITKSGNQVTYTAPGAEGDHTLTVTSVADPSKQATASIKIRASKPAVTVALSPSAITLATGASQSFNATVSNSNNVAVTWTIDGVAVGDSHSGTIAGSGSVVTYTAPASPGTHILVASSVADPTKSASSTLTIEAPIMTVSVVLNPTQTSLNYGDTTTFSAAVSGSNNTGVNWSVDGVTNGNAATGVVTGTGLSISYTAPASSGSHTLTATSAADPSQSASSTISVQAPPSSVAVSVNPGTSTLTTSGTASFTATVSGSTNTAVSWTVDGVANGNATVGTIAGTGNTITYTAPTAAGSHSLVATSLADGTKSATASITVQAAPSVSVALSPGTSTLTTSGTASFTATVSGSTNTAVSWKVDGVANGNATVGTIAGTGNTITYTAPTTAGSHSLVATSLADGTKSATASITVQAAPSVSVSLSPGTSTLTTSGTASFTATVSGSTNTAVSWTVDGVANGNATVGTIAGTGNTITYTAPTTAGSHSLVATSLADGTKSATASITVQAAPTVSVALSPGTSTLTTGGTASFTATVSGSTNTSVSWKVDGVANGNATVGTVAGTGNTITYTAPAAAGSHSLVATSQADGTKSATASITVQAAPPPVSVSLSPSSTSLTTGSSSSFTATVSGSTTTTVTWMVDGVANGNASVGTITGTGNTVTYTAPASAGSHTLTATSVADGTKGASGAITVQAPAVVSVTLNPGTASVAASTSVTLTATVSGSTITAVTWGVDGIANGNASVGTITTGSGNTVTYLAPATVGTHTVTATSVQDVSKTSTATITVSPAQVAPVAPVINGPKELQALAGPYTASMILDASLGAQWSITGGTLVSATNGDTVQFQAGNIPVATLHGVVSNTAGSASSDRWMVTLPFAPRDYSADLNANLAAYRSGIPAVIATGDVGQYYALTYYMMGMISGAEATGNTALMDELLGYIDQMIAQAKPVVRNGVTTQQWGPFDVNGNPNQAYTFMCAGALARVAAVINKSAVFKPLYGAKADQIVSFVDQSIFKYWFDKTTGVYAAPTSAWPAGQIPWLSTALGGWGTYTYWANQCTHLGLIATWMYQASPNPVYLDAATRVGNGFKSYLVATNGHWIWNQGKMSWDPDNLAGCPDTSHASREPMMLVSMFEAGIVFTASDVDLMAHTFLDAIWNQSETDPMFSNYIDGSNLGYRTATAPGSNGLIYHGWNVLGRYSPEVQRVLALSNQLIRTRSQLNVSLAANASSYGLVELSGILARNTSH